MKIRHGTSAPWLLSAVACGALAFQPAQAHAEEPKPVSAPAADPDPDIELASHLERGFQKLAKRVAPCVVSLEIKVKQGPWTEELRRMNEQQGAPLTEREGSGVVIEASGLIVTNE